MHVSQDDLPPEVIACAETQERFCWICHPDLTDHILSHYNDTWDLPSVAENARASKVGTVNTSGIYKLTCNGEVICEAKALDITCGLEDILDIEPIEKSFLEPKIECEGLKITVEGFETTIEDVFEAMITSPNYCSRESIIKHYDKNIIGNTEIEAGEADAGVIAPLQDLESYVQHGKHPDFSCSDEDKYRGVAVAGDGNGRYGRISPYLQGLNASVEAMYNVAAVGAEPRALTDCLNYGNPQIPEQLWQLSEGIRGIADAAQGVTVAGEHVPIISGNVSLYNGRPDGSSIDPTAIVCCVGVVPDVRKAVSSQLQSSDSILISIGSRKDECGGSVYYQILEELGGFERDALLGLNVPEPNLENVSAEIATVTEAISSGLVRSCHDISDGGLLLTLFEMTLPQRKVGGDIGLDIDLDCYKSNLSADKLLFSQSGGFVMEISKKYQSALEGLAKKNGIEITLLGHTSDTSKITIRHGEFVVLDVDLPKAHNSHKIAIF